MANPKRKISRSKRDHRRANWMGNLISTSPSICPNCGEPKQSHRACLSCGYYKGQKAFTPTES